MMMMMSLTHTHISSDLNDSVPNRYELTLQIAETAKRLKENNRESRKRELFGSELGSQYYDDKVIYQSLVMKASEIDLGDGLIG
jgi:hypothetical protein